MKHRTLGSPAVEVSAIALGTMGMTMAYRDTSSEAEAIPTIRGATTQTRPRCAKSTRPGLEGSLLAPRTSGTTEASAGSRRCRSRRRAAESPKWPLEA
jgi:hypothetical protein